MGLGVRLARWHSADPPTVQVLIWSQSCSQGLDDWRKRKRANSSLVIDLQLDIYVTIQTNETRSTAHSPFNMARREGTKQGCRKNTTKEREKPFFYLFGSFPRQDWFCQRIHTGLGGFCFPSNVNGINHGDFQVAPAADVRWDESAELRQSVQGTCWLTMERLESRVDGGITTMFGLGSRSLVFLMGFACCMRDVCRGCCCSSWWKSAGHIQPTGFYHCSFIESFPLSSGRLDYMFYDRFEDLLFFFFFFLLLPLLEYISFHNNSIPDSVVCACSRRFAFITYFVFVFYLVRGRMSNCSWRAARITGSSRRTCFKSTICTSTRTSTW